MIRSIITCFSEVSRRRMAGLAALFSLVTVAMPAAGQSPVPLADQPPFASFDVPGNLALTPSVEFPTAISVANQGNYADATTYLGYFDPSKCYQYQYNSTTPASSYFQAKAAATGTYKHSCSGYWSGNFMNWATMQTIDPFRWALTGGYRSIDTTTQTILEKAWGPSTQGSQTNFPYRGTDQGSTSNQYLTPGLVTTVTPFSTWSAFDSNVFQQGNVMVFSRGGSGYKTAASNSAVVDLPTTIGSSINVNTNNTAYKVYVRVLVCDTSVLGTAGLESNCVKYGSNYKPEGLMQQYSNKIRFAALAYLNADGQTQQGGVVREPMGFIGPTYPQPLSASVVANARAEWDASTGIMGVNPDATTATASGVTQSGVMNFLNKFGQSSHSYMTHDNVSELYYAAVRYFENLGNVTDWDNKPATSALDGFPAVVNWDDPILYRCQKNFILGIGDNHTWYDYNVGGSTVSGGRAMPAQVSSDKVNQAHTWTQALETLQKAEGNPVPGSPSDVWPQDTGATYYIAGLAYGTHVLNIRPDLHTKDTGISTISTYWMDVMEYQRAETLNPYYLAAKYGGFSVPSGYDITNTTPLDPSLWNTSGTSINMNGTSEKAPDNYFLAGNAAQMVAALTTAFRNIANAITSFTTSFSLASPIIASTGQESFGSQYSSTDWTDTLTASTLTLAADGTPSLTQLWKSSTTLEAQLSGTGWQNKRAVATWDGGKGVPFEPNGTTGGGITSSQQSALSASSYAPSGTTTTMVLQYLRGDRTNEVGSTVTGSQKSLRARKLLLGDVVDASLTPVGIPSMSYSETHNPGYADFIKNQASRPTILYAAANDGMLHAFLGSNGTEQFAYVPSFLFQGPNNTPQVNGLAALGNPTFAHYNYVDATPKTFDLDMTVTGGTTTDTANTSNWQTLLIGGLGKGGKGYYALNVTNPGTMNTESTLASQVAWEFTDSTMGYSFGAANVVKTAKYGWVALLTSGYDNSDGYGYLYVVNPKNGSLLEKIKTPVPSSGLTQATGYVQDYTDYTADSAYVGDLNGQLWRFDLTGTSGNYPAPTQIATLTDASGNAQPVTSPPLIEVHPTTRFRYVMVGTGRLLASQDVSSSATQTFYSIVDGTAGAFNKTITTPVTRASLVQTTNLLNGIGSPTTGWYYDMTTSGERVIVRPAAYSGIIAWASTIPAASDPCAPSGASNVYAVNFATGQTVLYTLANSTTAAAYFVLSSSVTDLRFVKGTKGVELIAGDNKGGVQPVPGSFNGIVSTRLLNWSEVPTAE